MTSMNFDELFDHAMTRRQAGEPTDAILASLATEQGLNASDAQLVADLLRVDDVMNRGPLPMPSPGFANRVVAALNEPVPTASSTLLGRPSFWGAVASAAVAAAVLLMVTLAPTPPGGPAQDQVARLDTPAEADEVTVPDAVREGTLAYMQLVENLASTLGSEDRTATSEEEIQVASASPIGRAIQGSSETIRTAGQGLRVSVEPITTTALDAFGFLWRPADSSDSKQPSI